MDLSLSFEFTDPIHELAPVVVTEDLSEWASAS